MKKYFVILLVLLSGHFCFSQTTYDEYKYLAFAYANALKANRKPELKGYELQFIYGSLTDVRFWGLYKKNENKMRGMLVALNKGGKVPTYLCVPALGSTKVVNDKFKERINELTINQQLLYYRGLEEFMNYKLSQEKKRPIANIKEEDISKTKDEMLLAAKEETKKKEEERIKKAKEDLKKAQAKRMEKSQRKESINKETFGGDLANREILTTPKPVIPLFKAARIVLDLCVDKEGKLVALSVNPKGSTTDHPEFVSRAYMQAQLYKFAPSKKKKQCGTLLIEFEKEVK